MPKTVAFIPVRGGSKSIPLKNIKPMCGRPLVFWTVRAACLCEKIDEVCVATDSDAIKDAVESFKAELGGAFEKVSVVGRSAESASDTASTEFAMLEFAEARPFDTMVLIQATSPLLDSTDLDRGFEEFEKEGVDSILTVVPQKRFIWSIDGNGTASSVNYDVYARPRRQEFDAYYVENGAFYITSRENLLRSKNRVSGCIHAVPMDEDTFFEIDEPSDWVVIEGLLAKRFARQEAEAVSGSKPIKLFLTDCDGCLTDGGMYYSENGDELKKFNTRDGMGLALLRKAGVKCGIVTSEDRELNRRRAEKLHLDYLIQGCTDKLAAIEGICEELGIGLDEVAYVGDDVNDVPVLNAVGLSCCPADAQGPAREASTLVTTAKGGEGVIREVAEHILHCRID